MTKGAAREAIDKLGGDTPLAYMLRAMADETQPRERRDKMAVAAAAYCHPRLSAVTVTKRPAEMTDEEIAQLLSLTEEDLLRLGIGREKWPRPLH